MVTTVSTLDFWIILNYGKNELLEYIKSPDYIKLSDYFELSDYIIEKNAVYWPVGPQLQIISILSNDQNKLIEGFTLSPKHPLTVILESRSSSSWPVRGVRVCATMCYYVLPCATMCYYMLLGATMCYCVLLFATMCYYVLLRSPVNRQGVSSSWMLVVGLSQILVLEPALGSRSSRESSVTQRSFNWLASLVGWWLLIWFAYFIPVDSLHCILTLSSLLEMENSPLHRLHEIRFVTKTKCPMIQCNISPATVQLHEGVLNETSLEFYYWKVVNSPQKKWIVEKRLEGNLSQVTWPVSFVSFLLVFVCVIFIMVMETKSFFMSSTFSFNVSKADPNSCWVCWVSSIVWVSLFIATLFFLIFLHTLLFLKSLLRLLANALEAPRERRRRQTRASLIFLLRRRLDTFQFLSTLEKLYFVELMEHGNQFQSSFNACFSSALSLHISCIKYIIPYTKFKDVKNFWTFHLAVLLFHKLK